MVEKVVCETCGNVVLEKEEDEVLNKDFLDLTTEAYLIFDDGSAVRYPEVWDEENMAELVRRSEAEEAIDLAVDSERVRYRESLKRFRSELKDEIELLSNQIEELEEDGLYRDALGFKFERERLVGGVDVLDAFLDGSGDEMEQVKNNLNH